jgi:hypothetical protein
MFNFDGPTIVGVVVVLVGVTAWLVRRLSTRSVHWCLRNATNVGGVMRFAVPSHGQFSKMMSEFPVELYVIPEWGDAFERINRQVRDGRLKHVVVKGCPGIGKSAFRIYYMVRLLQENPNISILIQNRAGWAVEIGPGGNKLHDLQRGVADLPEDLPFLVDLDTEEEPDVWGRQYSAYTIVFSSPNPRRYKNFLKNPKSGECLMQPWSLYSILEAKHQLACYRDLTVEAVTAMYEVYGGVPRYVLERNRQGVMGMNRALADKGATVAEQLYGVVAPTSIHDQQSYMLVHMYRTEADPLEEQLYRYQPASQFVLNGLIRINEGAVLARFRRMWVEAAPQELSALGLSFEHLFVRKINGFVADAGNEPYQLQITRLQVAQRRYGDYEVPAMVIQEVDRHMTLAVRHPTQKLPLDWHTNEEWFPLAQCIFMQAQPGMESGDGLMVQGRELTVFQLAIGTEHPVSGAGLMFIFTTLNRRLPRGQQLAHIRLVFVIPGNEAHTRQPIRCTQALHTRHRRSYDALGTIPATVRHLAAEQWYCAVVV